LTTPFTKPLLFNNLLDRCRYTAPAGGDLLFVDEVYLQRDTLNPAFSIHLKRLELDSSPGVVKMGLTRRLLWLTAWRKDRARFALAVNPAVAFAGPKGEDLAK